MYGGSESVSDFRYSVPSISSIFGPNLVQDDTKVTVSPNRTVNRRSVRLHHSADIPAALFYKALNSPFNIDRPPKDCHVIAGGYSMPSSVKKHDNEDAFIIVPNLNYDNSPSDLGVVQYYAVFDGHGGATCAQFLKDHLHGYISGRVPANGTDIQSMLLEALKEAEDKFFQDFTEDNSGSCVVVCMITKSQLLLANIGDCRALLCRRDGIISLSTKDHRAVEQKEHARIEAAGGFVVRGRVFGLLAVSRSFGDRDYKLPDVARVVISDPEVSVVDMSQDHEFVVLASDGVWDVIHAEYAATLVHKSLFDELMTPTEAAITLVERAVRKGSKDDVTAVVVQLIPGKTALEPSDVESKKDQDSVGPLPTGISDVIQQSAEVVQISSRTESVSSRSFLGTDLEFDSDVEKDS